MGEGAAAMAAWASSWSSSGSKTYHRCCVRVSNVGSTSGTRRRMYFNGIQETACDVENGEGNECLDPSREWRATAILRGHHGWAVRCRRTHFFSFDRGIRKPCSDVALVSSVIFIRARLVKFEFFPHIISRSRVVRRWF